jgi:tRNA-2-methylthio-N6-dimethylallyladenosine synthase
MKKAFIQTFGCQMNEYDSQRMIHILKKGGYQMVDTSQEADLILLNSCSVREAPENKIYSFLGRARKLKAQKKNLVIGVGGCVAQQEGDKILQRESAVDLVFGTDNYNGLLEMLEEVDRGKKVLRTTWMPREQKVQNFVPLEDIEKPYIQGCKAYLSITKGCDNFCSYCIVPITRGREVSRNLDNILLESQNLVQRGIKEIILLGQNVNSYKAVEKDFFVLLSELSALKGLQRIRFTSPHPKDWNNELSDLMEQKDNICNQLHLPYQSGSNRIIKLMRRGHSIEDYLEKINYLKKKIPTVALSTDLIVGFPSETDADFEKTLEVLEQVEYHQVYAFKYSPRPGTRSAKIKDDVPQVVKEQRLASVLALFEKIRTKKFQQAIGSYKKVLVEGKHPKEPDCWIGRSEENISVTIKNNELKMGDLALVKIQERKKHSLMGVLEAVEQNHFEAC